MGCLKNFMKLINIGVNMKDKIFETLAYYKSEIEKKGHNVYAIMLKGSQNYNLDTEENLGCKLITSNGKVIYRTATQIRTFEGDIPKFIKNCIDKDVYESLNNKDISINVFIEVEEL